MALIHNVQAPENEATRAVPPTSNNTQAAAASPALVASGVVARRFEAFMFNVTEPHSKFCQYDLDIVTLDSCVFQGLSCCVDFWDSFA